MCPESLQLHACEWWRLGLCRQLSTIFISFSFARETAPKVLLTNFFHGPAECNICIVNENKATHIFYFSSLTSLKGVLCPAVLWPPRERNHSWNNWGTSSAPVCCPRPKSACFKMARTGWTSCALSTLFPMRSAAISSGNPLAVVCGNRTWKIRGGVMS